MNNNYCNKCGECCRRIVVDFNKDILYRDGIEPLTSEFKDMLILQENRDGVAICYCKYLKNNLCTNINKPPECLTYPSSPMAFIPENCGYDGDIFVKKEHLKQKIRKLKEEILDYEAKISQNPKEKNQLQKIILRHQAFINKYKPYGSDEW